MGFYVSKSTTLQVHQALQCISLSSMHEFDEQLPNFTFSGGRTHFLRDRLATIVVALLKLANVFGVPTFVFMLGMVTKLQNSFLVVCLASLGF